MYVTNKFAVNLDPTLLSPLELMSLSINVHNEPFRVFFYQPPSADVHTYYLCSYLQSIDAIHFSNFVLVTLMSILMLVILVF